MEYFRIISRKEGIGELDTKIKETTSYMYNKFCIFSLKLVKIQARKLVAISECDKRKIYTMYGSHYTLSISCGKQADLMAIYINILGDPEVTANIY